VSISSSLSTAGAWIRRRAENVVAGLLGIMFVAFIVQVIFRYFFNLPTGWTSELSVIAWLYIVLLGSAFWLKEGEEIRFDLLTGIIGPRTRRIVAFVVAVATVVLFGMALPATVSYVAFMKVESSSYMKIRMDILYSVYVLFALAVIVRYAWSAWAALRGEASEEVAVEEKGYGL
jgi:C4-dicarboxylate transporter, DctQ subunit